MHVKQQQNFQHVQKWTKMSFYFNILSHHSIVIIAGMGRTARVHRGEPRGDGGPALPGHQHEGRVSVGAELVARGRLPGQVRVQGPRRLRRLLP